MEGRCMVKHAISGFPGLTSPDSFNSALLSGRQGFNRERGQSDTLRDSIAVRIAGTNR